MPLHQEVSDGPARTPAGPALKVIERAGLLPQPGLLWTCSRLNSVFLTFAFSPSFRCAEGEAFLGR